LDKFNKKLKLPLVKEVKDLYMKPVSLSVRSDGTATATSSAGINGANNLILESSNESKGRELMYTQDSNTIFYYNDYRVVLLLDFSQSSTTTYPTMGKSYLEKMRECLSVITENLLFQIKNQFMQ
jgi:hypothetical protein